MAATAIEHPSLAERKQQGKRSRDAGGPWRVPMPRSGDPVAMAAYLGKGDTFDRSLIDFSEGYADQNEKDFESFVKAVRSGRLEAIEGV